MGYDIVYIRYYIRFVVLVLCLHIGRESTRSYYRDFIIPFIYQFSLSWARMLLRRFW